jgi:hypothetical protein
MKKRSKWMKNGIRRTMLKRAGAAEFLREAIQVYTGLKR